MKFTNRVAEYPKRKKLIKVDENNVPIPNEEEILVNIVRDDGNVSVAGTPLSAATLNEGNWNDYDGLSFEKRNDNNLPVASATKTKIVTKANGETWLVPPNGSPKEIATSPGTFVKVNGTVKNEINFASDPQTQINNHMSDNVAHITQPILNKINGIATGAQVNVVEGATVGGTVQQIDANKRITLPAYPTRLSLGAAAEGHAAEHTTGADQIPLGNGTTKGLSINDYTTSEKNKVANVPANVNTELTNINTELGNKLQKITSGSQKRAYIVDASNNQAMQQIATAATAGAIVERITSGNITVPATPNTNTSAASKQYVDMYAVPRDWKALWTGSATAIGKVTLTNDLMTALTNPKEVMILAATSSTVANRVSVMTLIIPIYILNTGGTRVQYLNPGPTSTATGLSANSFCLVSEDGNTGVFQMVVRFNTTKEIEIVYRQNTNLLGVYVR